MVGLLRCRHQVARELSRDLPPGELRLDARKAGLRDPSSPPGTREQRPHGRREFVTLAKKSVLSGLETEIGHGDRRRDQRQQAGQRLDSLAARSRPA